MRSIRVVVRDTEPGRPWIIRGERRETVVVPDGVAVWEAIHRAFPSETHTVEIEPGQGF